MDAIVTDAEHQFVSDHGYISQEVIDAGYLEGTKNPNITLSAECNGRSMLGGVCESDSPLK